MTTARLPRFLATLLTLAAVSTLLLPSEVTAAEQRGSFRVAVEVVEPCSISLASHAALSVGCAADATRAAPTAALATGQLQGAEVQELWCRSPGARQGAAKDSSFCASAPSAVHHQKIVAITF